MSTLHLHVNGISKLQKPPNFQCLTCMMVKSCKRSIPAQVGVTSIPTRTDTPPSHEIYTPGSGFHMDMGFVRGSAYQQKSEDGHIVTSLDVYNSYLLIINRATWYIWVFLSKYKAPPIQVIKAFLDTHGSKTTQQKFLCTDEGGALWGSHEF